MLKLLLSKDTICSLALGIALLVCIYMDYNNTVAAAIAGSLGGVITGKHMAEQNDADSLKKSVIEEVVRQVGKKI